VPQRAVQRRSGPDLAELAEDWLTIKTIGDRADDPGNSARARRSDLGRWAGAYLAVLGRGSVESHEGLLGWNFVTVTELADSDRLAAALGWLADEGLANSTRQRMLATLRGWCAWLTRRKYLTADPTVEDETKLRDTERDLDGRTFTVDQVDALLVAAGSEPGDRESSYWPSRDMAIVSVLSGCGLRISELCNLTPRSFDTTGQQAVFRLRSTKGGKGRVIPIPARTVNAIEDYLIERTEHASHSPALAIKAKGRLFVRNDGKPQTQPGIDRQLRRHCTLAGVEVPDGAMAHALRHFYGGQLALRGVPLPVIQQLLGHSNPATTSIYTRVTANDTTGVLDDAGWL
jgi:site-specific recombinase XerD